MSNGKMPDMNQLMRHAQKLQADVAKVQEEILSLECDGAAGGGLVTVTINGKHEVTKIKIDKQVVDPSDVGMLEDLVTAAFNAAATKLRELSESKMKAAMGPMAGMGLPGMF